MQKSELQICGPIREGSLHGERRTMDLTQSHKGTEENEEARAAPAPNLSDLVSLCESSRDSKVLIARWPRTGRRGQRVLPRRSFSRAVDQGSSIGKARP